MDAPPFGRQTCVEAEGVDFSPGRILRILVAPPVAARPPLLILEGTLHSMPREHARIILRQLCADEEHGPAVLVTHEPPGAAHTHCQLVLKPVSSPPLFRDRDSPQPG